MSNLRLESIFVTLTSNLLFSLPSLQYLYGFSMVSGLTSARINGSLWNFQNTFLGVWNDFLSNTTAGQGPILSLERQNLSKFRLYKYGSRFRKPSTSHWWKRCIKTLQNAFYRTVLWLVDLVPSHLAVRRPTNTFAKIHFCPCPAKEILKFDPYL